jgi:hypothetical protein
MFWILTQVTQSTPGDGVESIPEEIRPAHPAIRDDKCTKLEWKSCAPKYMFTEYENDRWDCTCTGKMMRGRSCSVDLCRKRAFMPTEAVPKEPEIDLPTYQIIYRTTSRGTVTKQERKRQSSNGIMGDRCDSFQEMMSEHCDQDHSQMTPNYDWIKMITGLPCTRHLVLSGGRNRRHRLTCLCKGLPNWMLTNLTGGLMEIAC